MKDPADGSEPGRYDDLVEGDIAVLGFDDGIVPSQIDLYLTLPPD